MSVNFLPLLLVLFVFSFSSLADLLSRPANSIHVITVMSARLTLNSLYLNKFAICCFIFVRVVRCFKWIKALSICSCVLSTRDAHSQWLNLMQFLMLCLQVLSLHINNKYWAMKNEPFFVFCFALTAFYRIFITNARRSWVFCTHIVDEMSSILLFLLGATYTENSNFWTFNQVYKLE